MNTIEDFGDWSDQEMMAEELLIVDELESKSRPLISLAYSVCNRLHAAGVVRSSGPADIPLQQAKRYLQNAIKTELAKVAINNYDDAWTIKFPVAVFWMETDEEKVQNDGIMRLRFYGLNKPATTNVMQYATKLLAADNKITVSKVKRESSLEFCSNSNKLKRKFVKNIFSIEEVSDAAAVLQKLGWKKAKIKTILKCIVDPSVPANAGEVVVMAMREASRQTAVVDY